MPSMLPTEDASSKAVLDFGLGPYNSYPDSAMPKGEDDENREPNGESLPNEGGSDIDVEVLISYPQTPSNGKHAGLAPHSASCPVGKHCEDPHCRYLGSCTCGACFVNDPVLYGTAGMDPGLSRGLLDFVRSVEDLLPKCAGFSLPGDLDRPVRDQNPATSTKPDVLPTEPVVSKSPKKTSESQLPSGFEPAARSDYFDHTVRDGKTVHDSKSVDEIWPYEDTSVYSDEENESLPGVLRNETTMDDFLGALGNAWSGYTVEDKMDSGGFPENLPGKNETNPRSNSDDLGGTIYYGSSANSDASYAASSEGESMTQRTATALELVGELTKEFLKENGKKGLVRRQVLSFLQGKGLPQYLASDIIRCMKHRHDVVIADVMDLFPISRKASADSVSLSDVHRRLVDLEIESVTRPEVASVFRNAAAKIAHVLVKLERAGS